MIAQLLPKGLNMNVIILIEYFISITGTELEDLPFFCSMEWASMLLFMLLEQETANRISEVILKT